MRILTLNTHSWLECNPLDKLEKLAETIFAKDYDVLALQEVNQTIGARVVDPGKFFFATGNKFPIREDNFSFLLTKILSEKGKNFYWTWIPVHTAYGKYHEGISFLSKNKFSAANTYLVSREDDFNDFCTRKILVMNIEINDKTISMINCHYSWWIQNSDAGFCYEWNETLRQIAKLDNPLIFLGDFNNPAEISGAGYDFVSETFRDAYCVAEVKGGGPTVVKKIAGWSDNDNPIRVDFIFVSKGFTVEYCGTVFDGKNTPIVSDHFGVEALLCY